MPNKTSMPALLAAVDLIGLCVQRATHSAADSRQKVHELKSSNEVFLRKLIRNLAPKELTYLRQLQPG